jgi:hypothetical protein
MYGGVEEKGREAPPYPAWAAIGLGHPCSHMLSPGRKEGMHMVWPSKWQLVAILLLMLSSVILVGGCNKPSSAAGESPPQVQFVTSIGGVALTVYYPAMQKLYFYEISAKPGTLAIKDCVAWKLNAPGQPPVLDKCG